MLQGLMQQHPLLISSLIEFAARHHSDVEIVSRRVEGDMHRYTWAEAAARSRRVARALDAQNVALSARVATLAWNGYRHLELYYGVSGSGRVLHTVNPRLHLDQIAWIINHADDQVVCFDLTFMPLVEALHAQCPRVTMWIALCDADRLPAHPRIPELVSYEAWIDDHQDEYEWPVFDEGAASSMCYTSGTTGNPKAVLYSHRSTLLHAYAGALPDMMGLSNRDVVLPVVPMFHVNAWGIPYGSALVGSKLVLPGASLDGASVYELIEAEQVTLAAGVPTIWQMLLDHMQTGGLRFQSLKRTVIGGSACPPAMIETFQNQYDVEVFHAWGMTELSPMGTLCSLNRRHLVQSSEAQLNVRLKQGRPAFGIDIRIVDAKNVELPRDGVSCGDLHVRGAWVAAKYFNGDAGDPLVDGWFPTGDVGMIDQDGYLQITDRSKDVIKSGGEWISSIDVENIAMAHPAVAMAACISVRHPKWDERPVIVVVRKPDAPLTREQLLNFYDGKLARWQKPDDVIFADTLPIGATGKILKACLRETLRDYRLPEVSADSPE